MSILSLIWMRISFFTMAGGGARGKTAGIAPVTMVQVGATIETFHLFTERYHQVGRMTIGWVIGKDINGTTSEYPTSKSSVTGGTGKKADIGRSKIPGASGILNPEHSQNNRIVKHKQNSPGHNPERGLSHTAQSNNRKTIKEASRKTGLKAV
jgi:hypothetical protein